MFQTMLTLQIPAKGLTSESLKRKSNPLKSKKELDQALMEVNDDDEDDVFGQIKADQQRLVTKMQSNPNLAYGDLGKGKGRSQENDENSSNCSVSDSSSQHPKKYSQKSVKQLNFLSKFKEGKHKSCN
jgi:hypothetical protein